MLMAVFSFITCEEVSILRREPLSLCRMHFCAFAPSCKNSVTQWQLVCNIDASRNCAVAPERSKGLTVGAEENRRVSSKSGNRKAKSGGISGIRTLGAFWWCEFLSQHGAFITHQHVRSTKLREAGSRWKKCNVCSQHESGFLFSCS